MQNMDADIHPVKDPDEPILPFKLSVLFRILQKKGLQNSKKKLRLSFKLIKISLL